MKNRYMKMILSLALAAALLFTLTPTAMAGEEEPLAAGVPVEAPGLNAVEPIGQEPDAMQEEAPIEEKAAPPDMAADLVEMEAVEEETQEEAPAAETQAVEVTVTVSPGGLEQAVKEKPPT